MKKAERREQEEESKARRGKANEETGMRGRSMGNEQSVIEESWRRRRRRRRLKKEGSEKSDDGDGDRSGSGDGDGNGNDSRETAMTISEWMNEWMDEWKNDNGDNDWRQKVTAVTGIEGDWRKSERRRLMAKAMGMGIDEAMDERKQSKAKQSS